MSCCFNNIVFSHSLLPIPPGTRITPSILLLVAHDFHAAVACNGHVAYPDWLAIGQHRMNLSALHASALFSTFCALFDAVWPVVNRTRDGRSTSSNGVRDEHSASIGPDDTHRALFATDFELLLQETPFAQAGKSTAHVRTLCRIECACFCLFLFIQLAHLACGEYPGCESAFEGDQTPRPTPDPEASAPQFQNEAEALQACYGNHLAFWLGASHQWLKPVFVVYYGLGEYKTVEDLDSAASASLNFCLDDLCCLDFVWKCTLPALDRDQSGLLRNFRLWFKSRLGSSALSSSSSAASLHEAVCRNGPTRADVPSPEASVDSGLSDLLTPSSSSGSVPVLVSQAVARLCEFGIHPRDNQVNIELVSAFFEWCCHSASIRAGVMYEDPSFAISFSKSGMIEGLPLRDSTDAPDDRAVYIRSPRCPLIWIPPRATPPHLHVCRISNAVVYVLGASTAVTVTDCTNVSIFVVASLLHLRGCHNVRLSTCARSVRLSDCTLVKVACITNTPIIVTDRADDQPLSQAPQARSVISMLSPMNAFHTNILACTQMAQIDLRPQHNLWNRVLFWNVSHHSKHEELARELSTIVLDPARFYAYQLPFQMHPEPGRPESHSYPFKLPEGYKANPPRPLRSKIKSMFSSSLAEIETDFRAWLKQPSQIQLTLGLMSLVDDRAGEYVSELSRAAE
ncbi:uncharacterized protein BJ171DRAFT_578425 [Polychytrium aggregatum]|uniref:uncharacterized protein n=1 Tax=Polychytrium aggregatum TaxID=110093 RepID=UPI0022FEBDEA|nr:uncharacterized protein BJ171DRAFT_578425 [Polychytrium aggregatum]KAI9207947.1 hypothetical protein BJ171DRAFT_578425 [Polychytrium aggregatum]